MRQLQVTTVVTISLGFIATLLAVAADPRAAWLILAAAAAHVAEEILARRRGWDEFSKRLGSMGAMVAFGIAPAAFVLNTLIALNPALLILPLLYLIATAIWLTRYEVTGRLSGMPVTVNGFVIPTLFLADFFTLPVLAGWLILSSTLMSVDIGLRRQNTAPQEYVVNAPEETVDVPEEDDDDDAPSGFVPFDEL